MVYNETVFGLESTQLKYGPNSLNELGWELSKYNSKKILFVVDPVLQDFGITQKILDQINLIPDISPSTLLTFQVLVNSYFDLNRI